MYWLDVLLSLMLPLLFSGVCALLWAAVLQRTALKPETLERVRRKNPVSPYEKYDPALRKSYLNGWEPTLDSEVQRLRRKSLGQ